MKVVIKSIVFLGHKMHAECYLFLLVTAKPQCESDFDCQFDQKCSQGNCVPACSLVSCGVNAFCSPKNHRGICECIPEYFGNPAIACNKGMFFLFLCNESIIHLQIATL